MLYLAWQFSWFLLAAFAIGFVMGWLGRDGGRPVLWSGGLGWLAALWALGAAISWSQTINGMPALWIESGLLFVATYVVGCIAGSLLARPAAAGAVTASGPVSALEAAVPDAAGKAPGLPAVENEADIPGQRPTGLLAARAAGHDDLKLIKGIGRQNEGRLHGLGIWHFDQIAAWTPANVEWIGAYLAFAGRIEREDWVGQAKALASGQETEFSRRARAGEVETSRDDGSSGHDNVAALAADGFEGEKPKNLLAAARGGKPDDLTLVKGIGPTIAADLNRLGIWHFVQIAELNDAETRYVSAFAGQPGRGLIENWREDADILAHGGETAHSRAVKAARKPKDV